MPKLLFFWSKMNNNTRTSPADQQATSATNPRFTLATYLAASVGLAGVAPAADAAIVTIDITSVDGPNGGLVDGGASYIALPNAYLYVANDYGASNVFGLVGVGMRFAYSLSAYARPQNLAYGSTIDSSLSFASSSLQTVFSVETSGSVVNTSPDFGSGSYMGFRFGSGPSYNYGWIEVTWSGSTNTFEILAAAYESQANTAILAGDVGGVSAPAPSPASLLALIVGGAALRQWRQRRRARQPAATACT